MCGGKMKKLAKFNAGMALGSLTAAVALLAGMPVAGAQTTAGRQRRQLDQRPGPLRGGGSFPGSFLVPGTNTSIRSAASPRGVYIFDASSASRRRRCRLVGGRHGCYSARRIGGSSIARIDALTCQAVELRDRRPHADGLGRAR